MPKLSIIGILEKLSKSDPLRYMTNDKNEKTRFCRILTPSVPYPEFFFWAYRYMYRDRNFKESIEECTLRQTDRQKLWLYLAAF